MVPSRSAEQGRMMRGWHVALSLLTHWTIMPILCCYGDRLASSAMLQVGLSCWNFDGGMLEDAASCEGQGSTKRKLLIRLSLLP